ncbi:MAG: TolC family outer membrane protein [Geminicoccaceae bacterium]
MNKPARNHLVAFVGAVALAHFHALPACGMTLEDALASAYVNNPQLAAARAAQRKLDEGVPQALALRRPTVQAQAGVGATNGATTATNSANGSKTETRVGPIGAVSVNIPIWTGGRADAAVAGARARIEAGLAALRGTEQDVFLRAATAYVDVLRDEQVVEVSREHARELAAELSSVKRRLAAGELRQPDVAATESQAAQGRARLSEAEGDLDLAQQIFRGVTGTAPDRLMPPKVPRGLPAMRNEAVAGSADNPAVAAARYTVDAAHDAVRSARAQMAPSLAAVGSIGYPISSGELVVNIPLLDGGLAESQARGAKQELAQRRLELDGQQIAARQDAVSAWRTVQTARASIDADQAQVNAARATRDGLAREATQGLRTQLDVLGAEQRLLDAQLALAGAHHDEIVAAYRLVAATGHLTARDLGLDVVPYDATEYATTTGAPLWDPVQVGQAYRNALP